MGLVQQSKAFIKSATASNQFPDESKAEIAVLGRSNAGKSTLINAILHQDVAFVGQKPGKTQWLNFFNFGPNCRLVDFPGYGYAKLSKNIRKSWASLIEGYLLSRKNLVGALVLVEIKRSLTDDEFHLLEFLSMNSVPFKILATKVDKLAKADVVRQMKSWSEMLADLNQKIPLAGDGKNTEIIPISARTKQGTESLRKNLIKEWVQSWKKL